MTDDRRRGHHRLRVGHHRRRRADRRTARPCLTPNTGVALPASTVVGTFTDANTFATTADFTATIDWGDGSPPSTGVVVATATPGVFDVEGGHTYAKPGVYTTKITVHDDGGSQVVDHRLGHRHRPRR